jgi:hypothetical protein
MPKSATDVMQEVLVAAVLDGIAALRAGSAGLPNNLLRDINAIHANTTFGDLPKTLQDAINASVRTSFARLLREGYSVSPGQPARAPSGDRPPRRDGPREGGRADDRRGGRPPRREGPGGGDRPRGDRPGGGRPGGGPRGGRPPRGSGKRG